MLNGLRIWKFGSLHVHPGSAGWTVGLVATLDQDMQQLLIYVNASHALTLAWFFSVCSFRAASLHPLRELMIPFRRPLQAPEAVQVALEGALGCLVAKPSDPDPV